MKIGKIIRRIFITKKCVLCGEVIGFDSDKPFCHDCKEKFDSLLNTKCHTCGYKNSECTCLPNQITKICKNGAVWCVFYDADSKFGANNLVFGLKREYNRDVVDFCTSFMAKNIVNLCIRHGINYKDYVVTYAPRRKNGKRKYGFDHSKKLAKALALRLGLDVIDCFINVGKTEQKSLTKQERKQNAKSSYFMKDNLVLENKRVFIVDDIITTGATMSTLAELLYEKGASDVIPVAYAKRN